MIGANLICCPTTVSDTNSLVVAGGTQLDRQLYQVCRKAKSEPVNTICLKLITSETTRRASLL